MIFGDKKIFAIESEVKFYVTSDSQMALGFFVIYIDGKTYGVREEDATMMGLSYVGVLKRLQNRGNHLIDFPFKSIDLALAYLNACYRCMDSSVMYYGMSVNDFTRLMYHENIVWAPDGDEAFDDGSSVLQIDEGKKVRLIAFENTDNLDDVASTLREVVIDADYYYGALKDWSEKFWTDFHTCERRSNTSPQ